MLATLSNRLERRIKRFARSQSGNMAAVVAMSAVPLMLAGGAAVDYGNWVSVEARLQAAVDAAALATAREINLSDSELERVGLDYFSSNFGTPKNTGIPDVEMTIGNGKVRISAKVQVDNYLMKVIGKQNQTVAADAEAVLDTQNLHVVLAFDNTGSMSSAERLSTLKVAATDFVEILFDSHEEASLQSDFKVGVVPFSQFVNVGPEKFGDTSVTWLDHHGSNPLSGMNFMDGHSMGPTHNKQAWDKVIAKRPQLSWPGCVEARMGDLAAMDTFDGSPESLFPYAFAPDEPGKVSENQACFDDTGVRSNCGNADKWVYYNNYLDDSLDEAPISGSDVDRLNWLQENNKKYWRNRVNTRDAGNVRGPHKGCNVAPIRPLTNQKAPVLATIDAMVADGYTHVAEGVAWAQRVLSPGLPFDESKDSIKDIKKVMILLTDGENTFDTKQKNHNLSTYTAYGFLKQAPHRLGASQFNDNQISARVSYGGLTTDAIGKQDAMMLKACLEAKKADTVIYAFAYNVQSEKQKEMLENCASSGQMNEGEPTARISSKKYFFDTTSNLDLVQSFQALANELRPPYLSQ